MSDAASLDDLVRAAMAAPAEDRAAALRLLQGNFPRPEPFLTLRQLGRALGFGVTTLRRWQVPGHDLGSCRRYRRDEVEAYLTSEAFFRRQAALRAERRSARATIPFGDDRRRPGRRQALTLAGIG
jgi:hypothetical protein